MPKSETEKSGKGSIDTTETQSIDESNMESLKGEVDRLRKQEKSTVRKAIELEMELQSARADRDMFRRRYLDAQSKLEQMTSTPYPVGIVEKVLPNHPERTVVRLLSGQTFVVKYDPSSPLKEGDIVALHQRSMAVIEVLPPLIDPNVSAMELLEKPIENYTIVGGLEEQLTEIREVIELSFTDPDAFKTFNISPPRGVLLYGAPGTGKTLIAKAVANATHAKFLYLAAPELVQKFIGEGARMVREIFKIARENAPVIIFIDEIDAIAAQRTNESQSGEREVNRTLMQLLAEMDGFNENDQVRIIAATNRIDILDPAILRPGRFDRIIELPMPDDKSRQAIFEIHIAKLPIYGVKIDELVRNSEGFSGADIKAACMEAAMYAMRDRLEGKSRKKINQKDFVQAIEKIKTKQKKQTAAQQSGSKTLYT